MSLKHQLTENVKLLQKAVIIRQNDNEPEALILQRSSDALSRPACWDLPGGNSEWPAANQVSMANLHLADIGREIEEETSFKIDPASLALNDLVHFSTYFDSSKQIFTVICGWLVNYTTLEEKPVVISAEHQASAWVKESELANYDFGGAKGAFVLDMIKVAFAKFQN